MADDSKSDDEMLDATVRVPEHVVHRSFDAETVLLNLRTGTYHGLNPTGGRMLELLQETGSLRSTAETIAREAEHPVDEVARDLVQLCADLAERGLIEIDGPGPG